MSEQPEALRLADRLTSPNAGPWDNLDAVAELRRLHQSEREGWRYAAELEQTRKELVEALKLALEEADDPYVWTKQARAAIAKAEGETK